MHILINHTRTYVVILNRHARGCICEKYTCVCKCIYTESLDMCACNFGNNLYMNHTGEVLPHLMPCGMQALANTIHRYSSTFPPRAFIKMNEHSRDLLSPRPHAGLLPVESQHHRTFTDGGISYHWRGIGKRVVCVW